MSDNKSTNKSSKIKSIGSSIGGKLLSFDKLGMPFTMTFDGGKASLATWIGTILSIILTIIVISYSAQKF